MSEEIKIDVAGLAVYDNGELHGVWISACDDVEHIHFSSIDEARAALEDRYAGCCQCVADFAEGPTEETTPIP